MKYKTQISILLFLLSITAGFVYLSADTGDDAVVIPCRFQHGWFYVPVTINGVESYWVLDTGACRSMINLQFARQAGVKVRGKTYTMGAFSTAKVNVLWIKELFVGTMRVKSLRVTTDTGVLPDNRRIDGKMIGGIMGIDIVGNMVLRIDYANETLTCYDGHKFKYTGNGKSLGATFGRDGYILVRASLDGKYTGRWLFDTGNAAMPVFVHHYARRKGLNTLDGIESKLRGIGGGVKCRLVPFEKLKLGDFQLDNPVVSIPVAKPRVLFNPYNIIGILGNEVFRHFVVIIDYRQRRVLVEKGENFNSGFPLALDNYGIALVVGDSGRIELSDVLPNSPAFKAGFEKGDVIMALENEPLRGFNGLQTMVEEFRKKEGEPLKMTILKKNETTRLTQEMEDI